MAKTSQSKSEAMTSKVREKRHLPSTILFFKVIHDKSLQDGKLMVPNKFTREYGSILSNPFFLKPPDGMEWKVFWTKDDGGCIWFQKGWREFATYYSLSFGYFVLFEYQETCHLKVNIFDLSALEIYYPFNDPEDKNDNLSHHIKEDSVEDLDEVTPSQKTKRKSTITCPQPRKKWRTHSSQVVRENSNLPQQVQITGKQSHEDRGGTNEHLELEVKQVTRKKRICSNRSVVCQSFNLPRHVQIKGDRCQEDRGGVPKSLKVPLKALNGHGTSSFKAPSFTVVMKHYCVDGYFVIIPSTFANKYLKEKKRNDTMLQVLDGRTWPVKFISGRFCGGWRKFALDNHLNVGDVCLFELTKSLNYYFEVTIVRIS